MDAQKLIELIDNALIEADNYVMRNYGGNHTLMEDTRKAFILLRLEIERNPHDINERVLRAMHDVGVAGVKVYENSSLGDAIGQVIAVLYYGIPNYRRLEPLRMEYGKGNPI